MPKRCGHFANKRVTPSEEMVVCPIESVMVSNGRAKAFQKRRWPESIPA